MSEDDELNDDEVLNPHIREELKQARADRKARAELEKELAETRRDSAFDKAGIPEGGMGALFRKAYDGDLTKEAIVAQATEFGVLQQQATGMEAELAALKAVHDASAAGGATEQEEVGAKFMREIDAAKSPEELTAIIARADPSLEMGLSRD